MAWKKTNDTYYGEIASAIRAKNGTNNTYQPPQMAGAISALPTNQPLFSTDGTMYFEEMSIPDTVTQVKAYAYTSCDNMRKLEIAGSVKTISAYAFSSTYITELILNEGIETFVTSAFLNHKCQIIAFPSSTKTIRQYAFYSSILNQIVDLSAFVDPNNLPTLENSNAFNNVVVLRYEVANQSMLDAFAAATNWSTYSGKYVIKGAS